MHFPFGLFLQFSQLAFHWDWYVCGLQVGNGPTRICFAPFKYIQAYISWKSILGEICFSVCLHCMQPGIIIADLYYSSVQGDSGCIVGSRRLHSKIKCLQQEVFHKTLKYGKGIKVEGSEVTCRRHNRLESELLKKSRIADSLCIMLLSQSKER